MLDAELDLFIEALTLRLLLLLSRFVELNDEALLGEPMELLVAVVVVVVELRNDDGIGDEAESGVFISSKFSGFSALELLAL